MSDWVQGRVVENIRRDRELFILHVDAQVKPFRAGQFTKLGLNIGGEIIARPYSMVNAPSDQMLEFYFNTVPNGDFTSRLSRLADGDDILVSSSPSGTFTLEEVPDAEHLWMLATGTAIGPFISILKTEAPWKRFSKLILVHGVRHVSDLNYQDTIKEFMERDSEKFTMVPFVTREDTDFAMKRRIPDAVRDGSLEERVGLELSPETSQVMLCGNPGMIRETKEILDKRGLKKNLRRKPGHVTTEHYWQDD